MRVRALYRLPPEKERTRDRARRLEWWTIGFMLSIILVLFMTMGNSQAMRTAWIEDILTLIPPLAFLVATRWARRPPDERYPYGYYRAVSIAFLVASAALLSFGVFLLYDSVRALLSGDHPTIGTFTLFGEPVWLGWVMIAALVYSAIPPVILGHMKLPLARDLHDKVLHADADMNKADWLTAVAAIAGILGIAFGYWWADAAAAAVISLDVVHDGWRNVSQVVRDLMDEVPTRVGSDEPDPLPQRVKRALEQKPWVREAEVRFREEGHVFTGEGFVVVEDETDLVRRMDEASREIEGLDWRLYDFAVVPVRKLP